MGSSLRPLGAVDLVLYDSDDNVKGSGTVIVDNDLGGLASSIQFAAPVTIGPGTYRLSAKPTQAVQTIQVLTVVVDSQGLLDALYGGEGATGYHSSRTDGGDWTDELGTAMSSGILYDAVSINQQHNKWTW